MELMLIEIMTDGTEKEAKTFKSSREFREYLKSRKTAFKYKIEKVLQHTPRTTSEVVESVVSVSEVR